MLTTVEPNRCHDKYVIILVPTWDIRNRAIRSQRVSHTGFCAPHPQHEQQRDRTVKPDSLHDKHLGRVSAASASCFVLGCWNGRRAGVLFITLLFGKAQWKKRLCLAESDAARSHQYSQHGHKSNTNEPWGSRFRSTKARISYAQWIVKAIDAHFD